MPTQAADTAEPSSRYSVSSIAHGMGVLNRLAQGPSSLLEISAAVGISKSRAFRLLKTFEDLGLVRHQSRGSYEVSGAAYQLAANILEQLRVDDLSKPILEDLRTATGETVNLGILKGRELVYAAVLESHEPLRTAETRGSLAPLHASALGRALLTQLSETQMREILPPEPFPRFTSKTVVAFGELSLLLHETRARGYAVELEECTAGVGCVAAPLVGIPGIQGALSISVPITRFFPERIDELAQKVVIAAQSVAKIARYSRA